MRPYKVSGSFFLLLTLATFLLGAAFASDNIYVEDFSTKEFCDQALTQALWDTLAGELGLHPLEINLRGGLNTSGTAYDVAVAGDYAFIADWTNGLVVIDISNTAGPILEGTCDTPGSAFGVYVAGDYAYVADQSAGLQIIDISDPSSPTIVGNYNTSGSAYDVTLWGNLAFVADGNSGLVIIDVSNPTSPSFVGGWDTSGKSYSVALHGDYAFVSDSGMGVHVFDVTAPNAPQYVTSYNTPGYAWEVVISGDVAYIADDSGGVVALNISNPAKLGHISTFTTPGPAIGIDIDGDNLYTACSTYGIITIDVSDPGNPAAGNSYNTSGSSYDIVHAGEYLFVADASAGLQILDVRQFHAPEILSSLSVSGESFGMDITGDILWLPDDLYGLTAVDISDPANVASIGSCVIPNRAAFVVAVGDYAYVAEIDHNWLMTVDISDPANPSLVDTLTLTNTIYGLAHSGEYIYAANSTSGIRMVYIGNPDAPGVAGSYVPASGVSSVAVDGNHLFAGTSDGFLILDISNPLSPSLLSSYSHGSGIYQLVPEGDYLYISCGYQDIYIFDISDPSLPYSITKLTTSGRNVAVSGDYAFVTSSSGFDVWDVTDPSDPFNIYFSSYSAGYSIMLAGDFLYGAGSDGLKVFWTFGRDFLPGNQVVSLAVADPDSEVIAVRLSTEQSSPEAASWAFFSDSPASYVSIAPDNQFHFIPETYRGDKVYWQAWINNSIEVLESTPVCSSLEIEWLFNEPLVDSIVDVPGDQGGWARIYFDPSAWDSEGSEDAAIGYNVFRRVEDPIASSLISKEGKSVILINENSPVQTEEPDLSELFHVISFENGRFILGGASGTTALPPGIWEVIGYIGAYRADSYTYLAPTLEDSSEVFAPSVYCVMALTSSGNYYVSPPDSGYSVDNIAPGVPTGLAVAYNTGIGNELTWNTAPEEDFQYFRLYRGNSEGFVPGPENLVHQTASTAWNDPEYDGWDVYYKITSLDHAGNESVPASAGTVTGNDSPELPNLFALHQNAPNPFNPLTVISFDIPKPERVRLSVFNVKGALVSVIADRFMSEGRKEIVWHATDRSGAPLASGIYFYRLEAGNFIRTRKMVLMR